MTAIRHKHGEFERFALGAGLWPLVLSLSSLGAGLWPLVMGLSGLWALQHWGFCLGWYGLVWALGSGLWALGSGLWALVLGSGSVWALGCGSGLVLALVLGLAGLGSGLWAHWVSLYIIFLASGHPRSLSPPASSLSHMFFSLRFAHSFSNSFFPLCSSSILLRIPPTHRATQRRCCCCYVC